MNYKLLVVLLSALYFFHFFVSFDKLIIKCLKAYFYK